MGTDEANAYEVSRMQEKAEAREEAAIEAWISGQLLMPIESFGLRATEDEMTKLESVLGNLITCHELRCDLVVIRNKVAELRDVLRAPFVRHCDDPANRRFIIKAWEQG